MARKPVGCGTAIFVILVVGYIGSQIDAGLRSNNRPTVSPPVAATAPTVNQYCKTPKKNGSIDARACDLSELCKDWVFYRKKIVESNVKGDQSGASEAQKSFAAVNLNLNEYKQEDVSACLSKNGG